MRVLLVALNHREKVVLLLHVGVLAVATLFFVVVHGTRVESHLVISDSSFDDNQILHLFLGTIRWVQFGISHFAGGLFPGAEGALGCHSISLVLLIRRQEEDVFVLILLDYV